jgi:hypothetical protein
MRGEIITNKRALAITVVLVGVFMLGGLGAAKPAHAQAEPYYYRTPDVGGVTCSSADGGSFTTGNRQLEVNAPAGLVISRRDTLNGSPRDVVAITYDPGQYVRPLGPLARTGLGAYPFTYGIVYRVFRGDGSQYSEHATNFTCAADGPVTTSFSEQYFPPPGGGGGGSGDPVFSGPGLPANAELYVVRRDAIIYTQADGRIRTGGVLKRCQTVFVTQISKNRRWAEVFVMGGWVRRTFLIKVRPDYGQPGGQARIQGCENQ